MPFRDLTDEELLLQVHLSLPGAQNELYERYFRDREYHCRRAAPSIYRDRSGWDMNFSYFTVFLECQNSFRFGEALFRNYFETALRHELFRLYNENQKNAFNCVSLDDPLSEDNDDLTFHDVVSGGEGDDPCHYIDYVEEAYKLKKAPEEITPEVLAVAVLRCEGLTFQEIAERLRISAKMAKDRYAKYEKIVKRILEHGSVDGFYRRKK
jgi:DNA-directed RNA polymerase specialized sigma24 family protein